MTPQRAVDMSPRPLIIVALLVGGLSTLLAVVAVSLHSMAQKRFEATAALWNVEAHLAEFQELQRNMRWEMGRFQRDPSIAHLSVELDAKACETGRWLSGAERRRSQEGLPDLTAGLAELDAAHAALHDAARRVDARLRHGDRAGAMEDLTAYGDAAMSRLVGAMKELHGSIQSERLRRQANMLGQESMSEAIVTALAGLAVLGTAGAALFLVGHRRVGLALRRSIDSLEKLIETVPFGVIAVDESGRVGRANAAAGRMLKVLPSRLLGQAWDALHRGTVATVMAGEASQESEGLLVDAQGAEVPVLWAGVAADLAEGMTHVYVFFDLRRRRELEAQLQKAQKLEAVGQLASGIAHEINTPAQFVGDSLAFLGDAYHDMLVLMATYRAVAARASEADQTAVRAAEADADLAYLSEQAPLALQRAQEGMARISSIVRAMKEFAHPGGQVKQLADLNKALETTLVIARNEYKYVADVECLLAPDLPSVMCYPADLNQVFLNLLVNAAHAVADRFGKDGPKGRIVVRSSREEAAVRVEIEDNGCGIPEAIRGRVFEPFFTTKAAGRGTGQGLPIARAIVVQKHGGQLSFESEVGRGTTFIVRLPIDGTQLAETLETRLIARAGRTRVGAGGAAATEPR